MSKSHSATSGTKDNWSFDYDIWMEMYVGNV